MKNITVNYIPNTGPTLREIYVFVSRDADGQENAIAGNIGMLGMTQMITGNPQTFELFRSIVTTARGELEAKGQTIHLLKFTGREEVQDWDLQA